MTPATQRPTSRLVSGEVAEPLLVLSRPDIRSAELLVEPVLLNTADGYVTGRVGDIVMTAYGGERYPIAADVFYGAYEQLARVGDRIVARRLIHVRRAWPVLPPGASVNYGDDRGTVALEPGAWLYQSDDDDFGGINAKVKHEGHTEVGNEAAIGSTDWEARLRSWSAGLAFLPAILTLVALIGFAASLGDHFHGIAQGALALETALLLSGVAAYAWMRRDRWALKAAVASGLSIAAEFQIAVGLLGHKTSTTFAGMALWRAAQSPPTTSAAAPLLMDAAVIEELKRRLSITEDALRHETEGHHKAERIASLAESFAVAAVVVCNLYLLVAPPQLSIELFAIWLPSVIGALHAFNSRRQVAQRYAVKKEFSAQLRFVREELYALTSLPSNPQAAMTNRDIQATLRVLCKIIGNYGQRRTEFALADAPRLPL